MATVDCWQTRLRRWPSVATGAGTGASPTPAPLVCTGLEQLRGRMDFDLDRAIEVLSRTSPTLQNLLRDVSDDWTRPNEGADTFSAFDVVGHLIDGEETDWMVRARIIL